MDSTPISMGTCIPLGDGSVGKTVILQMLLRKEIQLNERIEILNTTNKSKNIEMEFAVEDYIQNGMLTKISLQYYNFPGQVQKESSRTVTFNEILNIFEFLPALKHVHVLLLVYDTNRIYTLKSLENWMKIAIEKDWIGENSLVVLVSNKTDLQTPNDEFVSEIRDGIVRYLEREGFSNMNNNVISKFTSCKTYEGIDDLRKEIVNWIAKYGLKKN